MFSTFYQACGSFILPTTLTSYVDFSAGIGTESSNVIKTMSWAILLELKDIAICVFYLH